MHVVSHGGTHRTRTQETPQRRNGLVATRVEPLPHTAANAGSAFSISFHADIGQAYVCPQQARSFRRLYDAELGLLGDALELAAHLGRDTRRATVWQRDAGTWRALYHQGTVVL